jgi:hypothetical protein
MPKVRQAMQDWHQWVVESGTDPVQHPDGKSVAAWMNLANSYLRRPSSASKPGWFDTDDSTYKMRTKATVSFVYASNGTIVDGSEYVSYDDRTADTHLPAFVLDTFEAIEEDYGIARPDLTYSIADLNEHDGHVQTATPQWDGVMPGRAYAVAGKRPVITDGGTCVAALYTAGGMIGYRPMLGEPSPSNGAYYWWQVISADARVPDAVQTLAGEIYNTFFNDGLTGSAFNVAAPIWQELNFKACTDGSIHDNNRPLLRSSHMPNQYLYHNGSAMALDGTYSGSSAPVVNGNFYYFSRIPDPNETFPLWENPYGDCGAATGQSGNPWGMSYEEDLVPEDPGIDPATAHFCLDVNLPTDSEYSSS